MNNECVLRPVKAVNPQLCLYKLKHSNKFYSVDDMPLIFAGLFAFLSSVQNDFSSDP